jgi:hypothetical protein
MKTLLSAVFCMVGNQYQASIAKYSLNARTRNGSTWKLFIGTLSNLRTPYLRTTFLRTTYLRMPFSPNEIAPNAKNVRMILWSERFFVRTPLLLMRNKSESSKYLVYTSHIVLEPYHFGGDRAIAKIRHEFLASS